MTTSIGVEVTTSVSSGPSNAGVQSGRLHVGGLTEKGPISGSTVIDSIAKYLAVYGDRTAYSSNMFDTVRLFFEEGGAEVVVSRVVGPGASVGNLTLVDSAGVPTIRVEANDPGAHSAGFSVEVTSSGASTFDVVIRRAGEIVSRYLALTSPAELVAKAATNPFVKVTSLGSTTAAPGDNPAARVVTPLSAGNDDRANVTAARVVDALDKGTGAEGGVVAAPGYTADQIGVLLAGHAKAKRKIALTAPALNATAAEAATSAAALMADPNGDSIGLFYPHLIVPDGGATRTISPEGYVAAVRAKAHRDTGFWQVPAGDRARTRWVIGTVTPVDEDLNNELAETFVNGITTTGTKTRLYGWASLAADREGLGLLTARDALNNLTSSIRTVLEPFIFSVNDDTGHLRAYVESAIVGILDPIAKRGGFYSLRDAENQPIDPGYRVSVDTSLNTVTLQAENKLLVSVAVRLSPTAQLIQVEIIKVPLVGTV